MAYRTNFGDLQGKYGDCEKSRIAILPVPYDATSTWGKGADKGPEAIIEASANMELYDIETDSEVFKRIISTGEPLELNCKPEEMAERVAAKVEMHLSGKKFVVVLGGEHSVSIGAVKAHARHFKGLCVLQLDAHSDLRPEYLGSKFNHACTMSRIREICPVVQVGIRSMDSIEKKFLDEKRVFFAEKMRNGKAWIKKAVSLLSKNVYITIDLDVFDPGIMPSTGTPEPGGLGWYEALEFLKEVALRKNIVGFDVVELCPNPCNKSPDFLAAKLVYKLLSYKFEMQK